MIHHGDRGTYDHVRCSVCGLPWSSPIPMRAHGADCPRHAYRPPIRCNAAGEDVTATPGRWGFDDAFFPAESAVEQAAARGQAMVAEEARRGGALVLVARSPEVTP